VRREDAWLEEPEPIGYEIEEVDGYLTAYMVSQYWNGKTTGGVLIIASGYSRKRVMRRAEKFVAHQHRIWADSRDPSKTERVIMYQKPPKVGPKGPSGGSHARRSQR
jgi:hypothetical protein